MPLVQEINPLTILKIIKETLINKTIRIIKGTMKHLEDQTKNHINKLEEVIWNQHLQ